MRQRDALYQKEGEVANRPHRSRRRLLILPGVLVLIVLAGLGAYLLWGRPASSRYVTVERGTIRGTVIATGEVVSARQAQLSNRVGGRVTSVPVEVGEEVVTGTLLVAIEADTLNYRVEQARLQVEVARLRLVQSQEGSRPEEIALAQADLDLAEARLAELVGGARAEELTIVRQEVVQAQAALEQTRQTAAVTVETARLNWEVAANALREAQDAYSRIYWENERLRQRGIERSQSQEDAETSAWRRVEDAEAAMEQARLAYERALQDQDATVTTAEARLTQARARQQELLAGPTEAELAQVEAQVARARAYLELQQAGPRQSEVQIREYELGQAELSLEEALADLEKATLTAPFAGTVVEVTVDEGELVGVYAPLVRLADLSRLQIEARIDEIDVGQVTPGQAVTITLDAFPGQPLRGYIEEVAPAVTIERGSAFYLTTIVFGSPPTLTLRLGMAANLTVVTVEKEDVLLIPRQAVERVGAGNYVTVLREGRRERVRVTLGIADPLYYEVVGGLSRGERVLLP